MANNSYTRDKETLDRVGHNLYLWGVELRSGHKNTAWTKAQQEQLYFLSDLINQLRSVVDWLNYVVQGDKPKS